jgi:serine/threonine-protein kinase
VHRDVKPENVVLHALEGGGFVPKLVDFGISKVLGQEASGGTPLTVPGVVFGTPHYISPEQALESHAVDSRADVWSFGVLLYRMSTGRVPFDAKHLGALLELVFDSMPPSPASFGVPASVSHVVMRCLEKDPHLRPRDAGALKAALCDALGLPHAAGGPARSTLPSLRVAPALECGATVRPPRVMGAGHRGASLLARPGVHPHLPVFTVMRGRGAASAEAPTDAASAPAPSGGARGTAAAALVRAAQVRATQVRASTHPAPSVNRISNWALGATAVTAFGALALAAAMLAR